ncbi:hypothetical protein DFH08DRAFT_845096 [Mycena albidolilacea]|uniref:Uncharacterized protein n=1 Tax=Mycena albidolilacea TaxID=1033008 RepID=A0AAD7AI44_9AGAR|nr:hypothetical protein DFH08DRAFT_845096 [Mycena albidolilacea]
MSHANLVVKRAITECIESASFLPPSLPIVDSKDWPILLADNDHRRVLAVLGEEVFEFSLFSLLSRFIGNAASIGLLQATRQAINSAQTLRMIITKIDASLVQGIKQAESGGFHVLVGYIWNRSGKNTDIIISWVHRIFGPLLEVAKKAYSESVTQIRQARLRTAAATTSAPTRSKRRPADLLFLTNLKNLQIAGIRWDIPEVSQPVREAVLRSTPAIISLDGPLDPSVLARGTVSTVDRSDTRRGLAFHAPGLWCNPRSPSSIERESGSLELPGFEDHQSFSHGLLPAVELAPPVSTCRRLEYSVLTVLRHSQPKPLPEALFVALSEKEQLAELLKMALDIHRVNCQDAVVAGTSGTREQGGVYPSDLLVASPKTPNKHRTLKFPIKAKTPQTKTPRAKTPQLSKTPRRQAVGRSPFTPLNA